MSTIEAKHQPAPQDGPTHGVHHPGHDHPDFLAHHFETPKQQFEAGKLGMWLFIATEILLFGGLFVGYSVWRGNHPELFEYSSHYLDTTLGGINTAVLILSSFTMAAAVTVAQKNDPKTQDKRPLLVLLLVLTLAGAAGFMVIKYFEWTHKFHEGLFPGVAFYDKPEHSHSWDPAKPVVEPTLTTIDTAAEVPTRAQLGLPEGVTVDLPAVAPVQKGPAGFNVQTLETAQRKRGAVPAGELAEVDSHADEHAAHGGDEGDHGPPQPLQDPNRPANAHVFYNIYYMMTGLHGFHVIVGGIVITWLLIRTLKGEFHRDYFTPVDLGGLYWHVVDLIWIFLFPLFYLIH